MGSGASKEVHVVVVQSKQDGRIDAQIIKRKSRKEGKLSEQSMSVQYLETFSFSFCWVQC